MLLRLGISFIFVSMLAGLTGRATAGLDDAVRYGDVVAVYHFEKASVLVTDTGVWPRLNDSGPREVHAILMIGARREDEGKFGKGIKLQEEGQIFGLSEQRLILNDEFSIVAWVKLPRQPDRFNMRMVAITEEHKSVGAATLSVLSDGNILGVYSNFERVQHESVESQEYNVANNKWHHIAFTLFANDFTLYIDGESVAEQDETNYLSINGLHTYIGISPQTDSHINDDVIIDDLGFFKTGFSIYEIEALYNHDDGLQGFLKAMPVQPQDNAVTTWGEIKSRR